MARRRVNTTKLEIIQAAARMFLEKGYSATSIKAIADTLDMSTGHLTFYFPTKEHLLAELVDMLCNFRWKRMEEEADEGLCSVMARCLELTSMASASEADEVIRDFLLSIYTSPMCLAIVRKHDMERAKRAFASYRPEWTEEQFAEAELLCSGIAYATLMTVGSTVPLKRRIAGALDHILGIYGVPEEVRKTKMQKVCSLDYEHLGKQVIGEFREYVELANEQAFLKLLKR